MKNVFTLIAAMICSVAMFAQVNITYRVDVTNYVTGGATIAANGLRIGGDFAAQGATAGGNAMVDWSPSDANSAMTDLGGGVWEIVVTYPQSAVGGTQQYKYVNGDWGMNEGTDAANTIASGGCGVDDGSGNINRTLVIPANDMTVAYCWDACLNCDGSSNSIEPAVTDLEVSPNPTSGMVNLKFSVDESQTLRITVYDLTGKTVSTQSVNANQANNNVQLNIADLSAGSYIYSIVAGKNVSTGKIMKY